MIRLALGMTVYELANHRTVRIGTSAACDVVVQDVDVAPIHVTFKLRKRAYAMVLVPENGRELVAGDRITIGSTTLEILELAEIDGFWRGRLGGGEVRQSTRSKNPPPEYLPPMSMQPFGNPPGRMPPEPSSHDVTYKLNPPPPVATWVASDGNVATRPPMTSIVPPADPNEASLLATLARDPTDEPTRLVYADWLEGRGETEMAAVVRGEIRPAGTPAWRAIVSCGNVLTCSTDGCSRTWNKLVSTATDTRERACATCGEQVFYCNDRAMQDWLAYVRKRCVLDPEIRGIRNLYRPPI